MRVWLINTWETLPIDGESIRLRRTGLLAQALRDKGHEVTWWTSAFNHQKKAMRFAGETTVEMDKAYQIIGVPALGYSKNVSVRRLRDHSFVARNLGRSWSRERKPEVIVASYPTIDAAHAAIEFGTTNNIPVIVDVVDQWPDTFFGVFPRPVRWLLSLVSAPLGWKANQVFRSATTLIANGPTVVDWAINRSGRTRSPYDQFFAMSYPDTPPAQSEVASAERFWRTKGISETDFLVVFVGTIGRHFDFEPILRAARALLEQCPDAKFVICGEGRDKEALSKRVEHLPNVVFPGWIDYPEIYVLLHWAALGIAPYKLIPNFQNGIPNKPVEYLSASLPILMPFSEGYVWELIRNSGSGLVYDPHDSSTLVQQILGFYNDKKQSAIMRESANKLFIEHFHYNVIYNEMVDLIESVGGS